ncbi:exo 1,3/1,4-beta-D-glucan glucohydrolase [Actinosynnema sp. NPDC047251]|uniref:Glycoside hydrolase family protein n=1 Tax=Saccharothrix espanaensis (strain ATCC 51144 / DSM 44229 / JCM 9112 / NBRC 15066 / NRRL 15764) TaxID=1179773 RepID=K0K5E9_SACES|nr:exo 1,3/1,4-beta-D-glucan glucohydrolase [Saccharothrix espanaensis]CCH32074.1 Glycoside hydrolase family protein [Saccharothrix espanaensis DSM 44229]
MSRRHLGAVLAAVLAAGLVTAGAHASPTQPAVGEPRTEDGCARIEKSLPVLSDWPAVDSRVGSGAGDERRIRKLLGSMTLAEKVGQMAQAEIGTITPDEVREYGIGSVLNSAGSWPGLDKHAAPGAWLALADSYWNASTTSRTRVPVIWGTSAVHGHNNVYGATVFPHNIGLGAAHDPCLVREIGEATAEQLRATGQDWAYAPGLAVPQDDRWGRTYEGYSEDPRITRAYGYEAVKGLQGADRRRVGVLATAKNFVGDGGTLRGRDQGVTPSSAAEMINLHGQGYYGALAAGAQTVMVSYSSWANAEVGIDEGKLHGSKTTITDVLKGKMGFDGLVMTDWNGIGQVPGCSNYSCPQAINAGIDVVMVPTDWKAFIADTVAQVESGQIPLSRIDDAVTRILRVKLRAGVLDGVQPSARAGAGSAKALAARKVAREAVRESQVLLKNNGGVLPLKPRSKVLVVGKSADSLQNQTGGWTLSWQGTGNANADFPNGTTILGGLREALGAQNVVFSETGDVDPAGFDAVIAVIGETPYAEGTGDLGRRSLEAAKLYPRDLAVLDKVRGRGAPVVTVYVSGRPLHVNKELNRSDAFVASWLPGTEGGGVADLLVRGRHTYPGFTGTLSYSWPRSACQTSLNPGQAGYDPLFKPRYGLKSWQRTTIGQLDESSPAAGCDDDGGGGTATEDRRLYVAGDVAPYRGYIASPDNWDGTEIGPDGTAAHSSIAITPADVNATGDGLRGTWPGTGPGQVFLADPAGGTDLRGYLNANAAVVFDVVVHRPPANRTALGAHCGWPCLAEVDVTKVLTDLPVGTRSTVKIPVSCLAAAGLDLEKVNIPFLVFTDGPFEASFANVRWVPKAAQDPDAKTCADVG